MPFTALCQAPPCLLSTPAHPNGFSFGWAFPAECQYIASWQDNFIDCHGAMNRQIEFINLTVAQDTVYTVTAGTDDDPLNLVWSIWDSCPFQGGNLVASIACGGWECIEWGSAGFEAVVSLPAGQYWMWAGMYSDGVTCTEGVVNGQMSIGGECSTPPPPNYLPCPTVTIAGSGQTVTYCDDQLSEPHDTGIPCSPDDDYITVEFTTDGQPYPIHVWSDHNYVDFPTSPINYADFAIYDGCGGELLYTTYGLACSVGSSIAPPAPNGIEYTVFLDLPAGTYIAVIGFWAAVGNPYELEGCIDYTFGAIGFLNGAEPPQELPNASEREYRYVPRYTKVVIEGRGLFIWDGKDGRLYDLVTRRIIH
jgi:hypothetical protein